MPRQNTLLPVIGLLLIAIGCDGPGGIGLDDPDFGDPYMIAVASSPDLPDEPPIMTGDSLHVAVQYAGGCRDHDFQLQHRTRRDTMELWFVHDANDDNCEAAIFERLRVRLPDDAQRAGVILLRDPASTFSMPVMRER